RIRTYISAMKSRRVFQFVCSRRWARAAVRRRVSRVCSPFGSQNHTHESGKLHVGLAMKESNLPAELTFRAHSEQSFVSSPRGARVILISVALGAHQSSRAALFLYQS